MADEYDERMQELIEDEDGDTWTPAQLRAAAEAMVRDERGEGSFGGLEETNAPNADVDELVKAATATQAAPERELNPANFGKFFKDNIFSGSLGTGYVTGKRPMTAVDYLTDVAIGYGGGDLGKRNAALRQAAAKEGGALSPLKAAEAGQNIKTGRAREEAAKATTTKSRVETEKLTGDLIQQVMMDVDSDVWAEEMKALAKEHGVNIRPGIMTMTERMAKAISQAGAKHPAEILQDPDRFDPALVNRVRHTMRLLNRTIEESRAADLAAEEKTSALGIKEAEENRKSREFGQTQSGYDAELTAIQQEIEAEQDPEKKRQLQSQAAALQMRGTAAEAVMQSRAGIRTEGGARQERFRALQRRAEQELEARGEPYTPADVDAMAIQLENRDKAAGQTMAADAKAVAEKRRNVAMGKGELNQMRAEMGRTGMGKKGAMGSLKSRGLAGANMVFDIADVRAVDAVNATLTNIARSLGGQKGVLSDTDVGIIMDGLGFSPGKGDTLEAWNRRVNVFESIVDAGLRELEAAEKEGREPVKRQLSSQQKQLFRPLSGGATSGAAERPDKEALAADWSARIKAENDPAKKAQLRQQAVAELRGQ